MAKIKSNIQASEIANFLDSNLIGDDISINSVATLGNLCDNAVSFIKEISDSRIAVANNFPNTLFIVPKDAEGQINSPHILVNNPRLDIGRILEKWFKPQKARIIAKTAIIDETARIGEDTIIGEYCVIGANVEIGKNCDIRHHVVIADNCKIGDNTIIKSQAVIGEEGFATEKDEFGNNQKIAHIGGVIIGNDVEIGATSIICCGTIEPTYIGDFTKIDDNVFIAHNVQVAKNCTIIANSEISGSAILGENVWVAPQSTILESVKIGKDAYIGLGSVVIRDCEDGFVYVGNPARKLRERY